MNHKKDYSIIYLTESIQDTYGTQNIGYVYQKCVNHRKITIMYYFLISLICDMTE